MDNKHPCLSLLSWNKVINFGILSLKMIVTRIEK